MNPIKRANKGEVYNPSLETPALTLWYRAPATKWVEALPIGNGKMGAMIFGGIANETVQLNEGSIWYGGPLDRNNPDSLKYLGQIRQLLLDHQQFEAEDLADFAMKSSPPEQRSYQILENLELFFEDQMGAITEYHRELNLDTGIVKTNFKCGEIPYQREFFCSVPDQIVVIRLETVPGGKIHFRGRFERSGINDHVENNGCDQIRAIGQAGPEGVNYELGLKTLSDGGTIQTIGEYILVKDATAVTLLLFAETSYYNPDYHMKISQMLDEKSGFSYTELKERHIAEHQRLFRRVSLEINSSENNLWQIPINERLERIQTGEEDNGLFSLYFQYGRYLLMSCSRSGTLPATLQGLWNESLSAPWGVNIPSILIRK